MVSAGLGINMAPLLSLLPLLVEPLPRLQIGHMVVLMLTFAIVPILIVKPAGLIPMVIDVVGVIMAVGEGTMWVASVHRRFNASLHPVQQQAHPTLGGGAHVHHSKIY